jgi:hypothetical protein
MGADIHLFIETIATEESQAEAWSDGEIELVRDYDLFCALAGVRGDRPPLFAPRGLPRDVSSAVFERYFLFILDAADRASGNWDGFRSVDPAVAEGYLRSGKAHRPDPSYVKFNMTSPLGFVSNPDWHTPSWLGQGDLRDALSTHKVEPPAAFLVVQDLLDVLVRRFPDRSARIVFWFDN